MKKAIIFLLCMILLAGCNAAEEVESQTPTNAPLPTESAEVTVEPTPPAEDGTVIKAFRAQRMQAILGIIPSEYLIDIPEEELNGAEAELNNKSCSVTIEWVTKRSMKDAAALLSEKLPYDMVQSDNDWRNPDGTDFDISTRVTQWENGLRVTYILDTDKADGTILTDGFLVAAFFELPQELDPAAAHIMVSYYESQSVWRYNLRWSLDGQGQSVTDKLSGLYISKDGYEESNNDGHVSVQYKISRNEKMNIGWRTEGEYSVDATYEYTMLGHLESELMQSLLEDGLSILVSGLPEECRDILYEEKSASLTYYVTDGNISYSMTGPDNDSHPFAEKAELLTGAPLTQNEHGGFFFAGDGYSLTIKFNQGKASWEYEMAAEEGFTHPYIHDIYPIEYEPVQLETLKERPYSMSTGYGTGDETEVEMKRIYVIEDKKAAERALDGLKDTLSDYPGFVFDEKDERTVLECNIKEYRFSCVLEEKDGKLLLNISFRYRQ